MDQLSHFAHILPLVTLLIPSNILYIKQQVTQKLLWSLFITVHVTDETADTYFCYCTIDVYIAEAFFNPWIIFPLIFFSFLQSLHLSTSEILMNRLSLLPEVPSWLDPCKQQPLISIPEGSSHPHTLWVLPTPKTTSQSDFWLRILCTLILAAVKTQNNRMELLLPMEGSQAEPVVRPWNSFSGSISYDSSCHLPVTRLSGLCSWRTAFGHFTVDSVGSWRGILYCVQLHSERENFLLLWKILFLCITSLAKSLNVSISSEMEARRTLWLFRYRIQGCIFGSSLAFFINAFCRVTAYK